MIKAILILLLASACAAQATITRIQSNKAVATAATTLTITLSAAPTPGNYVIVAVATGTFGGIRIPNVTGSGISWQAAQYLGPATNSMMFTFFGRVTGGTPSASIVIGPLTASTTLAGVAVEYSATNALRMDQTVANSSGSTTVDTGTFVDPTVTANELLFAAWGNAATSGGTFSAPTNSFTLIDQIKSTLGTAADRACGVAERFVTSTGTYQSTATVTSGNNVGVLISFDEAAGGGTTVLGPRIPSIGN